MQLPQNVTDLRGIMKESLTENDAAHDDEEKSVDILLEFAKLRVKRCRS